MTKRLTVAVGVLLAIVAVRSRTIASQTRGAPDHTVTTAQYEQWKKDLSNWNRWGKDDEIGTMNLITPAKRKQAAALVKEGVSVSLASDPDTEKAVDNPNPYELQMQGIGSDRWGVSYHGIAHTHLDSLAHINENGVFFNGYQPDPDAVIRANHHFKNSIHNLKTGILTRGVLIDIPRLKGVPYLEQGTPIYVEDLEAWEKQARVKVGPGDALFIRTGRWARRAALGPWEVSKMAAGLDASVIPWLRQRDVAVIGSESALSATPFPSTSQIPGPDDYLPVHNFVLVALGMNVFDNCDLDALAEAAASRKRWEFLLTAAPLPMVKGTGSPI